MLRYIEPTSIGLWRDSIPATSWRSDPPRVLNQLSNSRAGLDPAHQVLKPEGVQELLCQMA